MLRDLDITLTKIKLVHTLMVHWVVYYLTLTDDQHTKATTWNEVTKNLKLFAYIFQNCFFDTLDHIRLLQAVGTIHTELLHQLTQLLHPHFAKIDVFVQLACFFQCAGSIVTLSQVFADLPLDALDVVAHLVEWSHLVRCAPLGDAI